MLFKLFNFFKNETNYKNNMHTRTVFYIIYLKRICMTDAIF